MTDTGTTDALNITTEEPLLSVLIFGKNNCSDCRNTARTFTERGVPFTEINVENDTAPREEFGGLTPRDHVVKHYGMRMPVVVVSEQLGWDESWSGARIDKILETIGRFDSAGLLIPADQREKH